MEADAREFICRSLDFLDFRFSPLFSLDRSGKDWMITRTCSSALKHINRAQRAEVTAALAQLPAFLVPSFSQPQKDQTVSGNRRRTYTTSSQRPAPLPSSPTSSSFPLVQRRRSYATAAARPVQIAERDSLEARNNERLSGDRKGKGKATLDDSAGEKISQQKEEEEDPAANSKAAQERRTANYDPEVRRQLTQLVMDLPSKPSRQDLLDVRKVIKSHDRLHDSRLIRIIISLAIDQKFYDLALRLLNESAKLMLSRETETKQSVVWMYVEAAQHLGRLRRWEFVIELTNQALSKGLVSAPLFHSRMRGLNRRSRYVDTIATFELYDKHRLPRDGPAYDEVIEAHLLNADLPTAQAVLAEKGEKGFPTTAQTCLTLFDGMALYGGNRVMEEKVLADADEVDLKKRKAVRQDVRVLNKIMSVRAGRDAARDALAMLDYYNLERYPPGLFDQFRQLALPSEDSPPPPSLGHWKPSPDRATIVTLTGLALRYRRPDLASDLLSSPTARSHQPNDHIVASIVRTLITAGSISAAEEFVFCLPVGQAKFRNHTYPSFQPSSFVYEVLLTGILRFRGLAGVNECFRRMTEAKLPPLKVTEGLTRALVDYLALEKMEKLGVSADLLIKVKEITAGRTKPTRENLNTLLKAAWMSERLSLHEWTKMRKSIENEFPIPAQEDGIKPPQRPLPPIAQLLARQKHESKGSNRRLNSLAQVRDSLIDRNIRHSSETAVQVLRNDHLIRFISAKWDYLQAQVLDLGVRPTYDHFTVLIRAYLVLGDIKGAVLALRYALTEAKIDPHVALYSTMISGLSRLGRHDVALTMYEELRETPGLEPDRQLFASLAMSCSRMRDLDGLERILEEIKTLVNKPLPGKNVDPAFLAQVQVQAQNRKRLSKKEEEEDSSRLLPYDPLLDPFFVTIYYRTLNVLGRNHDAQVAMRSSLDRGLVPDRIVWEVLDQTGAWLRWKENKDRRENVKVERSETRDIWEENFKRVRQMMKQARPKDRHGELRMIEQYWEKAERKDVDEKEWAEFFRDSTRRRNRKKETSSWA
ncbi:uncharacterized protein JCM6883_007513 [Sporobolomyces salmoneus]|uniref:uncharacterized protein n=1 Tax=Sporobolomyces salmoneus TaxID=183962 RepID=UPI003182A78D